MCLFCLVLFLVLLDLSVLRVFLLHVYIEEKLFFFTNLLIILWFNLLVDNRLIRA